MSLSATVVDPLVDPVPSGWDTFVTGQRMPPAWDSRLLRSAGWCAPRASTMVLVSDGPEPVAAFHTLHLTASHGRFATPGAVPGMSVADCRTAPAFDSGVAFSEVLSERDRTAAAWVFERALRRRAGTGGLLYYRSLSDSQVACLPDGRRLLRRVRPSMVLDNRWSDLPGYLATLPRKWRSQLQRIRDGVDQDGSVQVSLAGNVEPDEASWLSDVVRRRHRSGLVPFPPIPASYFARLGEIPGSGFMTYRDQDGRLLAFATLYDDGDVLWSGLWGYRSQRDGGRRNLYFDVYLRQIRMMVDLGRRQLVLGAGLEELKARFGARAERRWGVLKVGSGRGRSAGVPAAGRVPAAGEGAAAGDGPATPTLLDRLGTWAAGRQAGNRRVSSMLRRVRTWSVGDAVRLDLSTSCRQCGEWASVTVTRLGAAWARYWCQRCSAVVHAPDRRELRPLAQLREPVVALTAAPEVGTAAAQEVMPAAMWRWVSSWSRKPVTIDRLDRARIYQLYSQWDAYLRAAEPDRVTELAAGREAPPVPGLPAFSAVVTALNRQFYRPELVVQSLGDSLPVPRERAEVALRERAEHARRWLAQRGADTCWIPARPPAGGLLEPDRAAVESVVAALRSGGIPPPAGCDTALAALFGTHRRLRFTVLHSIYPVDEIVAALQAYLDSGARPLRQDVLARLASPLPLDSRAAR